MPIRGLVFDLFGTLVTRGPGPRAYRELVVKLPPWKWRQAHRLALTGEFPTISDFHAQFGLRVMLVNRFHDVLTQETKSAGDEVSRHNL